MNILSKYVILCIINIDFASFIGQPLLNNLPYLNRILIQIGLFKY